MKTLSTTRRICGLFSRLLIVCAATLALANAPAFAQEEVAVSTIGQADDVTGTYSLGYTVNNLGTVAREQAANAFTTGTNSGGYTLTEAAFLIEALLSSTDPVASGQGRKGNPGPIRVAIHEHTDATTPGAMIGSAMVAQTDVIAGTNPVTFTPPIPLAASTSYFMVLSAANAPAPTSGTPRDRTNNWNAQTTRSATQSESPTNNGWSIGDRFIRSTDEGVAWTTGQDFRLPFSVKATTIPSVTDTSEQVEAIASEQVEAIASHVARAIISSTVSAVAGRIRNIAGGGVNVAGVNIGGVNLNNTNFASAVQTNVQAFATNSAAMKTLLGNSDVSFPLNAAGSDGSDGGGVNSVAVWASGEYSDVSGDSKAIDWDGELSGFHLGMDGKIQTDAGNQIVIGAAVSALESEVDYTDETASSSIDKGISQIDMITTTPYIGFHSDAFDLWASVGLGDGELTRTPESGDKTNDDVTQTSYAIGGGAQLVSAGNTWLRFNGEAMQSELDIDSDSDNNSGQTINLNRVRMAIELGLLHNLASGGVFEPSIEFGARYDGGDGETGTGIELGGQLAYYSATGFTAQGNARVLLAHDGGYEEWGIQGTIRKQSGHDGQGLAFHLTPAYGDVNSGVSQLLAQGLKDDANDDANNTTDLDYQINLTTRLGYGIAMRNANGMLTPYTEMVLGTTNQYRMGINWKPSKAFNLTLLSEQSEQNAIRLQGAINF